MENLHQKITKILFDKLCGCGEFYDECWIDTEKLRFGFLWKKLRITVTIAGMDKRRKNGINMSRKRLPT